MHGHYSVKSGYKLLAQTSIQTVAEQGSEEWKWLWKIQAPPKTKHLLWRICKGCLPTRKRLKERYVQCPLSCPICDNDEENDWHFLYDCESSKRAWQGAGIDHLISTHAHHAVTAKESILNICRNSDRKMAGRAAMLIWVLWNNRNNWVWNNVKEQGQHLGIKAMSLWNEWEAVQFVTSSNRQEIQQQQTAVWQKPSQGKYKCNVDAGFHEGARKTST
ncbi:pentatricopeptide repeat-containing protein, partial [Trifolium medium]|nr:pentatricopeptide repeat-containing protein [Trifolium medium]